MLESLPVLTRLKDRAAGRGDCDKKWGRKIEKRPQNHQGCILARCFLLDHMYYLLLFGAVGESVPEELISMVTTWGFFSFAGWGM